MNVSEITTPAGLEAFLKAYHQELTDNRDFPPLKIQKALHSAAAVFGMRNGETLLASMSVEAVEKEDQQAYESKYEVEYFSGSGWTVSINGEDINSEVFDEEKVNYTYVDREDQINDLYTWIGEASEPDRSMMKQDLEYLVTIDDDYVFSSIETNNFVAQSDAPARFDEICQEILDANNAQ